MPIAAAARGLVVTTLLVSLAHVDVGCASSAGGAKPGGGGGNAGGGAAGAANGGDGGAAVAGGGAGASGGAGKGGATAGTGGATAGTGGSVGGAGGVTGGGGATAGAAGAAAGTGGGVAGATGGGGGALTTGAGGGMFVMCDDHADFNGRGLCSPTAKFGAVIATQTLGAGGAVTSLTAAFGPAKPVTDLGCTQAAVGGACTAFTCPRGATNPAGPDAGPITAKSSGGMIVTKPGAAGAYDVAGFASALWATPKAALTFTAAGGAIPTFSETFCGPVSASITQPAAAPGPSLVIARSADLAVQWTGAAAGDVELVLRDDTTSSTSTVEVRCFFTGASGQGTIPAAALAKLPAGAHTFASYVWVRKIGGAGGTCVELTGVNTNVSAATGAPFNGAVTLQ